MRLLLCLVVLGSVAAALEVSSSTQGTASQEVSSSTQPASLQPSRYDQSRQDALEKKRVRRNWQTKLRRLSRRYAQAASQEEREEILNQLYALKDPEALSAVVLLVNDPSLELRRAAVTILSMRAVATEDLPERLVDVVLSDPSDDIRYIAAGALADADSSRILRRLLRTLRNADPRSKAWAAIALGYLGDPKAVAPLIDELFVRVVVPAGTTTASGSASYVTGWDVVITGGAVAYQPRVEKMGGSQSVAGGSRYVLAPNLDAREALIRITGQDFGLDQNAWRAWWKDAEKRFLEKNRKARPPVPTSRPREEPKP